MAEIKAASHHHVAGEAASIGDGFRFPLSRNMRYCRGDTAEQQIAWLSISLSPGFRKNRQCRPTVRRDHPGIEFIARDRGASYGDTQPVSACSEAENHRQLPRFVNEMGVLVDIVTSERDPEKEPQGRYRLIEGRHANAARRQMHWPIGVAVGTLLVVTVLVALVSEVFVESVQKAAETFGISPAFVGFIIVSIVGAAAEMAVAFSAARKNRLGMSVSIALGSASQIALFVAPALVLLSYIVGPVPMNLQFWPGAVTMVMISAVMATFITNKLKRRRPRHPVSEHVFEGKPDARQSADVATPVSRFRPRYRALTPDEKALHDAIKQKADELVALFEQVKPGRYPSGVRAR